MVSSRRKSLKIRRWIGIIMKVEILCTGDEVLSGKIINSNFAFMSGKLEEVGISVIWGTTVGDNKQDLL